MVGAWLILEQAFIRHWRIRSREDLCGVYALGFVCRSESTEEVRRCACAGGARDWRTWERTLSMMAGSGISRNLQHAMLHECVRHEADHLLRSIDRIVNKV